VIERVVGRSAALSDAVFAERRVGDAENTSHVWDEHFETDQQALTEALRALDVEPLEFLGRAADRPLN
jgi:hypothetical protein